LRQTLNLSQFTVKNNLRRVMRPVEATTVTTPFELMRASGLLSSGNGAAHTE